MQETISIEELRRKENLPEICSASNEPIFITHGGGEDLVIMSMAVYRREMQRMEFHDKIMEGLAAAEAGYLVDGPAAMEAIRKKYAL